MKNRACFVALFLLSLPAPGLGNHPDAADIDVKVTPGELVVDHPTLINLGFEWVIQGDDNRNADPDGIAGQSPKTVIRTVTVRTRAEPEPYAGGRIFHTTSG